MGFILWQHIIKQIAQLVLGGPTLQPLIYYLKNLLEVANLWSLI